jgi:hypothetical protein
MTINTEQISFAETKPKPWDYGNIMRGVYHSAPVAVKMYLAHRREVRT